MAQHNVVQLLIGDEQIEYRRILGELAHLLIALDQLNLDGGPVAIRTLGDRVVERTERLVTLSARYCATRPAA